MNQLFDTKYKYKEYASKFDVTYNILYMHINPIVKMRSDLGQLYDKSIEFPNTKYDWENYESD